MPFNRLCIRGAAVAISLAGLFSLPSQPALAASGINAINTAWVMICTALLLSILVPGLMLVYGGLVRTKNTISVMMQVVATVAISALIWITYGYTLVFSGGSAAIFIGGFDKLLLRGVTTDAIVPFGVAKSAGVAELSFISFHMIFACLAPALIVGALAERIRFSAALWIGAIWLTFAYFPIAHMAWYGPSTGELAAATAALAKASGAEARRAAEAALVALQTNAGLFTSWRALDYAGGTVIHINAGIAGLIGAMMLGKRFGYGRIAMIPHSPTTALLGAGLMWMGWIGFNGGSAFAVDGIAALAVINTITAGAAGAAGWLAMESVGRGKPSLVGTLSGIIAGLVAITPCAGYVAPIGAVIVAAGGAVLSYWACTHIKSRFDYDDALDVFGIHCIAGIFGSLTLAVFASPLFGGVGAAAVSQIGGPVGSYSMLTQFISQLKAVLLTLAWSAYVMATIFFVLGRLMQIRPHDAAESDGLDASDHDERAYNL